MEQDRRALGRRDVLLESRRNGGERTVAICTGGRRRGVGAAIAACEGAMAAAAGAWSWGGDESSIYWEARERICWWGRGEIGVPVSVHGGTGARCRQACSGTWDGE